MCKMLFMNKYNYNGIKNFIRKVEGLAEVICFAIIYFQIWIIFYRDVSGENTFYGNGKFILIGIYAVLIYILFFYCDAFKFGYLKFIDALTAQWIALVIVNLISYFQISLIATHILNPLPMILLTIIEFALCFVFVYLFTYIYHRMYVPKNMVMIYGNKKAITLKLKMEKRSDKYHISKVISAYSNREKLKEEMRKHDAVVINDVPAEIRNDILKFCYGEKIRAYVVPKITDIIISGGEDINLFDTPLFLVKGNGPTLMQLFMKRLFDIILCIIALIPGLPIMLVVAIMIKLDSKGPVFFRQERITKNGRSFQILKFRSMIEGAEKDGVAHPAEDEDPRITRVGKRIRKTRIDELPQIFNILKGDMSIVGPRPERLEHYEKYSKEVPEFYYRTKVKGGLTGYAQIYGKYNTSPYDKVRLDLMYIENYSLLLDLRLILMTLPTLMKRESTEGFDKVIHVEEVIQLLEEEKTADEENEGARS